MRRDGKGRPFQRPIAAWQVCMGAGMAAEERSSAAASAGTQESGAKTETVRILSARLDQIDEPVEQVV